MIFREWLHKNKYICESTTTEEDFQKQLDANPDDWQTRMVFADWLEEHDDPRALGMRALGMNRLRPNLHEGKWWVFYLAWGKSQSRIDSSLPMDWFELIDVPDVNIFSMPNFASSATRKEIENAAALAFSKLPAPRRINLLNSQ